MADETVTIVVEEEVVEFIEIVEKGDPGEGFDGDLDNYTEASQVVAFVAGAATVDMSTSSNVLTMALTENSALTATSPVTNKSVDLVVTHTGGPWTLSLNGTDLVLEGAAGETEYLTARYTGTVWHVFRAGVVDVTI